MGRGTIVRSKCRIERWTFIRHGLDSSSSGPGASAPRNLSSLKSRALPTRTRLHLSAERGQTHSPLVCSALQRSNASSIGLLEDDLSRELSTDHLAVLAPILVSLHLNAPLAPCGRWRSRLRSASPAFASPRHRSPQGSSDAVSSVCDAGPAFNWAAVRPARLSPTIVPVAAQNTASRANSSQVA